MAQATHQTSPIAHANLAHVYAHMEMTGELAHQVAKIYAFLSLEIEHRLVAVEQELHHNGTHLIACTFGKLLEHNQRLFALLGQFVCALDVFFRRNANNRLQRRFQIGDKLIANLHDIGRCRAELSSAFRFNDYVIVCLNVYVARVEPENLGSRLHLNRCYPNHVEPLLS